MIEEDLDGGTMVAAFVFLDWRYDQYLCLLLRAFDPTGMQELTVLCLATLQALSDFFCVGGT